MRNHTLLPLAVMLVSALVLVSGSAAAVTVNITYGDGASEGFNDPTLGAARRTALEYALNAWSAELQGTVPLALLATFDSLGGSSTSAILGQAGSTSSFRDEPEFPLSGVWYPAPLASQLKGSSLSSGGYHMNAVFNADVDGPVVLGDVSFYYGTDGNPPANTVDFVSVALHEFGHAFGFFDLVDSSTGAFAQGYPDAFARYLKRTGAVNKLFTAMSNTERLAALTSGEVYWTGANVIAAGVASPSPLVNAQGEVEMFAPNPYQSGSSIAHWDQDHTPDLLMEPAITNVYTDPGVTLDAMEDIGWTREATEGEGEGEEDCTWDRVCPDIDAEGAAAYAVLAADWTTADLDGAGIVDSWEAALFIEVLCNRTGALHDDAVCAYAQNLAALQAEASYTLLQSSEHVLAVLLATSTELQTYITSGLALAGDYAVVGGAGKAAGEPLSPQGNPDRDAFPNLVEYNNTVAASLTRSNYVVAALNSLLDGSTDESALPVIARPGWAIAAALLALAGIGLFLPAWRKRETAE